MKTSTRQELHAAWRAAEPAMMSIDPGRGIFVADESAFLSGARAAGVPHGDAMSFLSSISINVTLAGACKPRPKKYKKEVGIDGLAR